MKLFKENLLSRFVFIPRKTVYSLEPREIDNLLDSGTLNLTSVKRREKHFFFHLQSVAVGR